MFIVDKRDEANRVRRKQKLKYDGRMTLAVPLVRSGLPQDPDELEKLRAENEELKEKLSALQEKRTGVTVRATKTVQPVKTVRQVYTDGIGE